MTRKRWAILILAILVGLETYRQLPDSQSRQLNGAIAAQASAKLKAYPYQFRVIKVSGDTAYVSTPRSVQVPAFKMLGALYPELDTRNPNDPAFIAAQQLLGEVQGEAREIVLAQPGIKDVRWELDRGWLAAHAIDVPQ